MSEKPTIRRATAMDATRVAELSGLLGYPVDPEIMERRLERLLSRSDHIVLVAESSRGEVAGWIHAVEHDILEAECSCEILGLVVDASYRGRGMGRSLVQRVEQWACDRGLRHVSVRSNVARAESHPFYEQTGYMRVKTQHAYRKRIDFARRYPAKPKT